MALVDSRPTTQHHLHGNIEMIDSLASQRKYEDGEIAGELIIIEKDPSEQKKDDIVLVTVTPLVVTPNSTQDDSASPTVEGVEKLKNTSPTILSEQKPPTNREASRRYSMMMASLAAAQVEESRANLLRKNNLASSSSPDDAASTGGMKVGTTAMDGCWEWQTRLRDHHHHQEDDYSVREKYFADEL